MYNENDDATLKKKSNNEKKDYSHVTTTKT